ncbi:MAG: hypothetical protein ACREHV_06560 [Rhizomicrobium sp.]
MSLEIELESMMTQAITVEPFDGADSYGQPTYGQASVWPCLTFPIQNRTLGKEAIEVLEWTIIYAPPDVPVDVNARVTLPDGTQYPVLGVEHLIAEDGPHHLEIYVAHKPYMPR